MSYDVKNPKPPQVVEGQRIILRARTREQSTEMFSLIDKNREHLRPWMPWEATTKTEVDSLDYIDKAKSWWEKGSTYDYSIFEKSSSKMIGSFGLHSINWAKKTCEFGYWISHTHQGKGFVTEALKLGEDLAQNLGFHRLVITCDRLNLRSQKVTQALAYKLESVEIDECIDHHGKWRDTLRFSKLVNPKLPDLITYNLPAGYAIKLCESEEFWNAGTRDQMEIIFDKEGLVLRPPDVLSEQEKSKIKSLNENFKYPYMYHSLLFFKNNLAGWMWGYQDSRESFYMVNSAILPEHRGRGLYSRLLEVAMKELMEKGFQRIWSRHNATNNAVIAPKLKRGFLISGSELSDVFGSLVHLTYFTNKLRRKTMDFRSGQLRPDDELRKAFKL